MKKYELHAHTHYSNAALGFSDTTNKLENLIKEAHKLGHKGIAITDHEILGGHFKATQIQKKEEYKDFKIILGNEIYLLTEKMNEDFRQNDYKNAFYPHFLLIALDDIGHQQLRTLSCRAWERSFFKKGLIRRPTLTTDLKKVIGSNQGHLVGSTACIGGLLGKLVLELIELEKTNNSEIIQNKKEEIHEFITFCIETFGKNYFFIELQPGVEGQEEQKAFNKYAVKIANAYGLKYFVTCDVHYLSLEKKPIHTAYLNSKDSEREVEQFYASCYLMTEKETFQHLSTHLAKEEATKAIENTNIVGDMVQKYNLEHKQMIPVLNLKKDNLFETNNFNKLNHLLKNKYSKYDYIKKFAESKNQQDRYLLFQIEKGLKKIYNINQNTDLNQYEEELNRINIELGELYTISLTLEQPLSSYYNTFNKIIDIMWNEGNSLVGISRGSVLCYYITYLIGIVQTNPLEHGDLMPFWRHLSRERPELPDIDIDTQQSKRKTILNAIKNYFGEKHVLNVCTYSELSSKTAILVACRGLGYTNDDAMYISSLIPSIRGKIASLKNCLEGTEDTPPNTVFINALEEFPNLLETASELEGLISQRGVHAAGLLILNDEYDKYGACMKSPGGDLTTQYDLDDTEQMGNIKFDALTVKALDRIKQTMNLCLKHNKMQWQGSLRKTYDKYLHPNNLNYTNEEMWKKITEIPSIFQFETDIGKEAIKRINPMNVNDLAVANSLMRLMPGDSGVSPLELYTIYKKDIQLWYKSMKNYGLDDLEINILNKYLKDSYGLADSQEKLMLISMDKNTSNFSLQEANGLRKAIAKKKANILEKTKQLFFSKGLKNQTKKIFLQYIWTQVFAKSFGYAFSYPHTYAYSLIALQEMNLFYFYPELFWHTACLIVDSASDEENQNSKSTDYGKIATAIGNILYKTNVKIALPDINKAEFGFVPDLKNNNIIFGLKGINGIGDDVVHFIIKRRPYKNFDDFLDKNFYVEKDKVKIKKSQIIQLIKAGCFDVIENKNKKDIMKYFIEKTMEKKSKLTLSNLDMLQKYNLIPEKYSILIRIINFKKYIKKQIIDNIITVVGKRKQKDTLLKLKNEYLDFFLTHFSEECIKNIEDNYAILSQKKLEKELKQYEDKIKNFLNDDIILKNLNLAIFQEQWNHSCGDDINKWDMDSLSFYFNKHELYHVNNEKYLIENFNYLPENPEIITSYKWRGKTRYKFNLSRIVGTVIDKNNTRHTITLLTNTGVVKIKMYEGKYNFYNRQISEKNEDGSKTILEKSWFTRGNKLLLTGYRRGDVFCPHKYSDTIYQKTILLITHIDENGSLKLKDERG